MPEHKAVTDDDPDGGLVIVAGLVTVGLAAAVGLLLWVVL